jgi:hypothetical protein
MSIRIRVSTCRKESTRKGNGEPDFGSYGAGAAISFEMDPSLMANPEAFVAKIREQYALAEAAMTDELNRLRMASAAARGPAAAVASEPAAVPPAKRPAARPPVGPAAEDYDQVDEVPEDDDPPNDGNHLLGWARNQPGDAKNWLIRLGKRLHYPNRILDWSPKQVQTAYQTYRAAQRG